MATIYQRPGERKWRIRYRTAATDGGRRKLREVMGYESKTETRKKAGKLEEREDKIRTGQIDPEAEAKAERRGQTIEGHLVAYAGALRTKNLDPGYIGTTLGCIRAMADRAGWQALGDIDADGATAYAEAMLDKGQAPRTVQAHLTAAKGFTRWLVRGGKLDADPLASVKKPNPKADRRLERRMLLPDEWPWLRAATLTAPERYGMTGEERVLLYETAIQTGLRAGELRGLTRGKLYLGSTPPYVVCKAKQTKNAKDARQYVEPGLAERLRAYIARKTPGAGAFTLPKRVAEMLREDLADARRAWLTEAAEDPDEYTRRRESDFLAETNHEGEVLDFHSLRHTCGAWLAMAGAHPKAVQAVMRHSTIVLTMDTYGHLFPGQEAETVALFGRYFGGASGPVRKSFGALMGALPARPKCPGVATPVTVTGQSLPAGGSDKPLQAQENGNACHRMASSVA